MNADARVPEPACEVLLHARWKTVSSHTDVLEKLIILHTSF